MAGKIVEIPNFVENVASNLFKKISHKPGLKVTRPAYTLFTKTVLTILKQPILIIWLLIKFFNGRLIIARVKIQILELLPLAALFFRSGLPAGAFSFKI